MIQKSILALLGVLALAACSASQAGGSGADRVPVTGSSGSGTGTGAGTGTGTGAGNTTSSTGGTTSIHVSDDAGLGSGEVMNGECAHKDFDLLAKPAEILILLDRSASMADPPDGAPAGSMPKWDLVVPGVNEAVNATNATVSWGLKVFPEGTGSSCVAGSVTSMIPVPIAAMNAGPVTKAVSGTPDTGNGTPTGDAVKAAVAYLQTLTDANPKYILLATDGEPSCANNVENSTTARTFAVQAVTDAATAGFKTFVVGVATTKATATAALNAMAVAGQMPRADTNPLATKFYLASTKAELVTSLETITGQVASCVFDLGAKPPPDPTNIAVHVNNVRVPPDTTHAEGWDYTNGTNTEVTVFGSWCDQIKAASANTVNFILGCPGEVIH